MTSRVACSSARACRSWWLVPALFVASAAAATDPPYLAQWPDVARVLADQRSADEVDSWARQVAALHQLDRAIEDMADERRWNRLTPDELALRGRYREASAAIREQVNGTLSNQLGAGFHWPWEEAPRQAWYSRQWTYESDPAFREATLSRYLSPELIGELDARKAASDARGRAAGRQMMEDLGHRESRWSAIGTAGRQAVAAVGALLALLLLPMLAREMRRFGLDPADTMLLRVGFARHTLSFITGVVDDYKSKSAGHHEGFDLFDGAGWYTVGISGADVAIPEGHLATAVSLRNGERGGSGYVLFVDHDAKSIRPVEQVLRRLLAPSAWLPLPVAGLAALIGSVSDPIPQAPPLVGALLFAMVAWACTEGSMRWARGRRVRRFVDRDARRIADAARRSAVHPGRPPARDAQGKVVQPEPATDQQMKAAAAEAMASLKPYIPVTGNDGQTLPAHVWTEPYLVGFVNAYAVAALREVTGRRAVPKEAVRDVAAQAVFQMARSHGTNDPGSAARRDRDAAGVREQTQSGFRAGQIALACFAGDTEALAHPIAKGALSPDGPPGEVGPAPPATGLHPDGPHALAARQVLAYLFSQQLVALGRRPD